MKTRTIFFFPKPFTHLQRWMGQYFLPNIVWTCNSIISTCLLGPFKFHLTPNRWIGIYLERAVTEPRSSCSVSDRSNPEAPTELEHQLTNIVVPGSSPWRWATTTWSRWSRCWARGWRRQKLPSGTLIDAVSEPSSTNSWGLGSATEPSQELAQIILVKAGQNNWSDHKMSAKPQVVRCDASNLRDLSDSPCWHW